MKHALAPLFGAGFTVAGCFAAGLLLLRWCGAKVRRDEAFPLAFVSGAACVQLVIFGIMALKLAYPATWCVLFGGLIVAGVVYRPKVEAAVPVEWWLRVLFGGMFAAFAVVYFVYAWAPETSPDGAGYHLEFVSRYARAHGFFPITNTIYASLSQGIEMLFEPAFALGRHSAAALVHFGFLIALTVGIFSYGRRIGKPWVGAGAALLVFMSPVVGLDGSIAYVDVATAAIVFTTFYWLEIWDESRDGRLLAIIGLLAGFAYAAKYTAVAIVAYAIGFVWWRARRWKPAMVVAACAAVMISPWMIRDWIYVHNPVAPFATELFPSPYFHPAAQKLWTDYLRRYDVANLWTLPMEVIARGDKTQGILGPVFFLMPLALLALRFRQGRRLLLAGSILLIPYFGNVGTRFLIPCLPFFALALTMALSSRVVLIAVLLFHAIASWPWVLPRYIHHYLWRIERFPYAAALRTMPEQDYLRKYLYSYPLLRLVEEKVPSGERVFALAGFPEGYSSHEIVQSGQNYTVQDFLNVALFEELQPTRELSLRFPQQAVERVRLVLQASGKDVDQWNVHELRFYDRGVEVRRAARWRLRGWPNSWEVQLAFDNSDATRWRSWQTASPGMYLDVDFGRAEKIDEVRMTTSHDYEFPLKLQVEKFVSGKWVALADKLEEHPVQPKGSLRRAATRELMVRGIHYMLVQDDNWGANDFADDPEAWGLEVVGRAVNGTLYRVLP